MDRRRARTFLRNLAAIAVVATCETSSAAAEPARLLPEGTFLADDGPRPFLETHHDGRRPNSDDPRYGRAALETVAILAAGEAYYWSHPAINWGDWDFPSGKTRLDFFIPTFDNNLHVTNDILHPIGAGSIYYWFARANGLRPAEALAYVFTASAVFELFGEWFEKASINDMIVTPLGGWAAGELWAHLGDYLGSAQKPRLGQDIATWTLGLPTRIHRPKGYRGPERPMPADHLGFSTFYWHRFQLGLGSASLSNDIERSDALFDFNLGAEIVAIPGHLRPGTFVLPFSDGEFTEGRFRMSLGGNGQQTWDLNFEATMLGRYSQEIGLDRKGSAWMIGLSNAYDFAERNRLGRYDGYALVHVLGPLFRTWIVDGDLIVRFDAAVHPDFAVIQALTWPEWRVVYGDAGTRSTLTEHGYNFHLGVATHARATVEYRGLDAGLRVLYGRYGSIDRWDRFQSDVTKNAHDTEQIGELYAWLGYTIPDTVVHFTLYGEHAGRTSTMTPMELTRWDRRVGGWVGLQF
ncbi:MAG: DUF3943 domain-containing protein [Polyangiales bacterium]